MDTFFRMAVKPRLFVNLQRLHVPAHHMVNRLQAAVLPETIGAFYWKM